MSLGQAFLNGCLFAQSDHRHPRKREKSDTIIDASGEIQVVIRQHDHLQSRSTVFWICELALDILFELLRPPRFSRGGITRDGDESHVPDPGCT